MEEKLCNNFDKDSLRSEPFKEKKPNRPNIRPKMNPNLSAYFTQNEFEKSQLNWMTYSSPSKFYNTLAEFCPYKMREKKKEKEKTYKEHILSPEKYKFSTKKFPKIE